jgi:lipopolysaccharide/colanic/teichoic acid biosynthesis glycosyltransferase
MELSLFDRAIKRGFDLFLSFFGLFFFSWLIFASWFLSTLYHKKNGFFTQNRIGRYGKKFKIIKIRTMYDDFTDLSTITTFSDKRISAFGKFLRKYKIDELPQLINVLIGTMSFVGPRPDVEGFADRLDGNDRLILTLRPGITGPATLEYKNEEFLLDNVKNKEEENMRIFKKKVKINIEYINNWSLINDIKYILKTLL